MQTVNESVFESSNKFAQCHASTLDILPDGKVICAWFGGSREGADDVNIWLSIRQQDRWSEPDLVVDIAGVPTWNPVLFQTNANENFNKNSQPPLLLFYRVGKRVTEWQSYVIESLNGGRSWSEPRGLSAGCLGPIKNKPIALSDGAWLAGSSVETETEWYCQIERSEDRGETWNIAQTLKLRRHPKGIIQPTLWESTPGRVHAMMRSHGVGRICRSDSSDGGQTWGEVYILDLPNNNSGIDVAKLVNISSHTSEYAPLALAFNPIADEGWGRRTPLVIATSYDNGLTWPHQITLQDSPGEYSYPAIVPTADGVAITYTFNRHHIQFARLSIKELQSK